MNKLKTIREWFDELRPDIREKALANAENDMPMSLQVQEECIHNAISGGFIWRDTPEGADFWEGIQESIRSGSTEFIKPTEQ